MVDLATVTVPACFVGFSTSGRMMLVRQDFIEVMIACALIRASELPPDGREGFICVPKWWAEQHGLRITSETPI